MVCGNTQLYRGWELTSTHKGAKISHYLLNCKSNQTWPQAPILPWTAGKPSSVITDRWPAPSLGGTQRLLTFSGGLPWMDWQVVLCTTSGTPFTSQEAWPHSWNRKEGENRAWNNPPINISINYPATCIFFWRESPYLSLDSQSKEGVWFDPAKEMGVKPLCSTKQENITFALIIDPFHSADTSMSFEWPHYFFIKLGQGGGPPFNLNADGVIVTEQQIHNR